MHFVLAQTKQNPTLLHARAPTRNIQVDRLDVDWDGLALDDAEAEHDSAEGEMGAPEQGGRLLFDGAHDIEVRGRGRWGLAQFLWR